MSNKMRCQECYDRYDTEDIEICELCDNRQICVYCQEDHELQHINGILEPYQVVKDMINKNGA